MRVVFDLDGTLRHVEHRRYLTQEGTKDWDEFFRQSEYDPPYLETIQSLRAHVYQGDEVQIWSGCSADVWDITVSWLDKNIGNVFTDQFYGGNRVFYKASEFLKRMRPSKDYRPDTVLKEEWLMESIAAGWKPDLIYDDRQSVVDMWRRNGIPCFQVAPGDFDKKRVKVPAVRVPTLTLMVGPSGAGKSRYTQKYHPSCVISSDTIRYQLYGDTSYGLTAISPEAYTTQGFAATFSAVRALVQARIENGLDAVIDATNLHRKSRVAYLNDLGLDESTIGVVANVVYVIVDRPLNAKLKDYLDKEPGHTNIDVIQKHHETFISSVKDALKGDGFSNIQVKNAMSR